MKPEALLLVPLIIALVACGESEKAAHARFEQAEKKAITDAVRHHLIDPDSAKFGPITVHQGLACATVNSKNRFGGYTGDQEAILFKQDPHGLKQGESGVPVSTLSREHSISSAIYYKLKLKLKFASAL